MSVTVNAQSAHFEVSQLSSIKYFRDKWTSDGINVPPSPEIINDPSFSMASFVKMVIFANQPKDRYSLKKLSIPSQDVLSFFKTCARFGVTGPDALTMPMMEEYFDSYPAVPGIPHKVLTSWYHAKCGLKVVTKFATKKMTEIYQLFNLPHVHRATAIMDQFRSEHSTFYDAAGALQDGVTRDHLYSLHYELTINFCHFYQCLVWSDFHRLVQSVTTAISEFTSFAEGADAVSARFETFPFHEVLFCVLGWVRKLKQHSGPQTRSYTAELQGVLSLLPPLMKHYWSSKVAQRRWHPEMPWIAENYFPKLFVRQFQEEGGVKGDGLGLKKKEGTRHRAIATRKRRSGTITIHRNLRSLR